MKNKKYFILVAIACITLILAMIVIFPKVSEFLISLNQPNYAEGEYPYYDVAVDYIKNDEQIREKYGDDLTLYVVERECTMYESRGEGKAKIRFWIKGRGPITIYLEFENGEWKVNKNPFGKK